MPDAGVMLLALMLLLVLRGVHNAGFNAGLNAGRKEYISSTRAKQNAEVEALLEDLFRERGSRKLRVIHGDKREV
jgi:hypothetical protein